MFYEDFGMASVAALPKLTLQHWQGPRMSARRAPE